MLDRSKQTVQLVQDQYNLRNIEIPKFLGYLTYLTYSKLLRVLSYSPEKISCLGKQIKKYGQLTFFSSALKQVVQGTQLKTYFINRGMFPHLKYCIQ